MSALSTKAVGEAFMACLHKAGDGEVRMQDVSENPDIVVVEGVVHTVAMSRAALTEHREKIEEMASRLPLPFFESQGGGWSFLNLCNDRDEVQWTSLHLAMEQLCSLLIGLDLASWLLPRDMWGALPAGMPYFVIHDDRFTEGVLG